MFVAQLLDWSVLDTNVSENVVAGASYLTTKSMASIGEESGFFPSYRQHGDTIGLALYR